MPRKSKLEDMLVRSKLPRHVGIIMDGNGRWACRKGLDRISGHREGMKAAKAVVKAARDLGIEALTLFAFSIQNWQRPESEVRALMELLKEYIYAEGDMLTENGIRLNAIGRLDELPRDVRAALYDLMAETRRSKDMVLTLALSYGGREEIVDAARRALADGVDPAELDERRFANYLYTHDLPDLDLIIRTSGEMRISNFMLWQSAYAELYVTSALWPDFRRRHLVKALLHYQSRERRFGLTSEQIRKRKTV